MLHSWRPALLLNASTRRPGENHHQSLKIERDVFLDSYDALQVLIPMCA